MKFSSVLLACSIAASATALPTLPGLANLPNWVPKSFQGEAQSWQSGKSCDISTTQQPQSTLPPPDSGLKLAMIALGKGTQNYTCPTTKNSSAVPVQVGALANLYDVSCIAGSGSSQSLDDLTTAAYQAGAENPIFSAMPSVGRHYYVGATPSFFLNNGYGSVGVAKNASMAAPASPANSVPWVKLRAIPNQKGPIMNVFRLKTDGGAAPATCGDMTGPFEVQYTAQYWYYVSQSYSQ